MVSLNYNAMHGIIISLLSVSFLLVMSPQWDLW